MFDSCCVHSKRRKKRGLAGLPVAGDKPSKDGKKTQMSGKVGDTSGKDKTAKKSHEADNLKSTAALLEVRPDTAQPDQGDSGLDDRSFT